MARFPSLLLSTLGRLLATFLCLPLLQCTSFEREWRHSKAQPIPTNDISGPWLGTWQNTNTTHGGKLRAVLKPDGKGGYDAHYHAVYAKVLTFALKVNLPTRREGDRWVFIGEQDLGKLAGGAFKYEGHATPTDFFSTYDSKYDKGTFTMKRPD